MDNTHLPMWHYVGFTGTPAWYSEMHKDIVADRIRRVIKANEGEGYKMRFCHYCEGPIGIMERSLYDLLYVNTGRRCSMCGNKAFDTMGLTDDA